MRSFPFCSDRCRLIDLGKWASGAYVISSPVQDDDGDERIRGSDASRTDASHDDDRAS